MTQTSHLLSRIMTQMCRTISSNLKGPVKRVCHLLNCSSEFPVWLPPCHSVAGSVAFLDHRTAVHSDCLGPAVDSTRSLSYCANIPSLQGPVKAQYRQLEQATVEAYAMANSPRMSSRLFQVNAKSFQISRAIIRDFLLQLKITV